MEKIQKAIRREGLSALLMALIIAFGLSLMSPVSVSATDFGDKKVEEPERILTIVFDPQGGEFEEGGAVTAREVTLPASYLDEESDRYYASAEDLPALNDRSGYTFTGWYLDGDKLEEGDRIFDEVTFEAQWNELSTEEAFAGNSPANKFGDDKDFTQPGEEVILLFDPKGGVFEDGTIESKEITAEASDQDGDYYYYTVRAEDFPNLQNRPGCIFEGWYMAEQKLEVGDRVYLALLQFDAKWKGKNEASVDEDVKEFFSGTLPDIRFGGAEGEAPGLSVKALAAGDKKSAETLTADAAALKITTADISSAVQLDIALEMGTVGTHGVTITMPVPEALAGAEEIAAIHYGKTKEAMICELSGDTLSFTLESFSPVVLLAGEAPKVATVYIKNVKGGAILAFDASRGQKILPVGENVRIDIGATLYTYPYPMEDGQGTIRYLSTKAETMAGRLIFEDTGMSQQITIMQDTIISAAFERVAASDASVAVNPAKAYFPAAKGGASTSISTTLTASRNGSILSGAAFRKSADQGGSSFDFSVTESGELSSEGNIALGGYTVYVDVTYGGQAYEGLPVAITSGSRVNVELYIADNVRSGDLLNMLAKSYYAKESTLADVLKNGYGVFPIYNYDNFAGIYTAAGKKVSDDDDVVSLDKNYYFLRHTNDEGKMYSLKVEALAGGSSGGSGSGGGSVITDGSGGVPDSSITEKADKMEVSVTGGSGKMSSSQLRNLISKNKDKPVVISGTNYTITFAQGTMQISAGQTGIDFGVRISPETDNSSLQGLAGDSLALVLNFNHSGALPGEASITIKAGSKYAGQTLHYYYCNQSTGQLEYRQSAVVDTNGFVTVTQNRCSDYVFLTEKQTGSPGRTYGENRYDTALEIARTYFTKGADTVVLVRGDISADALPAVPLAKKHNAPLLLTPPASLPDNVLAQIKALGAEKVIIVGGPGAIKPAVAERLESEGVTVERIYGANQYETAYEIAKVVGNATGQAALVNGSRKQTAFADALSIAAWAGYQGVPILYAGENSGTLPEATNRAFKELGISQTLLIGGPGVLPQALEALVPKAQRYAGTDRYDTNARVLKELQPNAKTLYVVSGADFADALAGAAVAAQNNGWLLLTGTQGGTNGLTATQQSLLQAAKGTVQEMQVFGGAAAVPQATLEAVKASLGL